MEAGVPARLTPGQGLRFGLTVGCAFLVLAALLWWRSRETAAIVAAALGAVLVLGGVLIPDRMGPVHRAWMALALAISKVTTPIFMGIIFFIVITPFALVGRALGHRPLERRPGASAWISRSPGARRSDLQRQF